jgi:transposase-like protein
MQRRKFSREFKLEAVKLVRERGVSVSQAYPVSRRMLWPRWIFAQSGPHKSADAVHHI